MGGRISQFPAEVGSINNLTSGMRFGPEQRRRATKRANVHPIRRFTYRLANATRTVRNARVSRTASRAKAGS